MGQPLLSLIIQSPAVAPCVTPYGLPILADLMAGLWLIVVCEPALGLAASMLLAKYPK